MKMTKGDDSGPNECGMYTAGIAIGNHGNAIECHGTTMTAAQDRRDDILADAARLDFVEANTNRYLRSWKKHWSFVGMTNYTYEVFRSLRDAIDHAMKDPQ